MAFEAVKDLWADGYDFGDVINSAGQGLFGRGGVTDLVFGWYPIDASGKWNWAGQSHDEEAENEDENDVNSQEILGHVANDATSQYLDDRAHTEMREDTAYQRSVEDMRKAGLNPYTIGASPAASTPSQAGSLSIASKVQVLGYLLDLKNLDAKNRQITNNTLTSLLGTFAKMG